jgi:Fis family transcriptional regulator
MLNQQATVPLSQQIKDSLKKYFANFEMVDFKHITNLYDLVKSEVERPLIEIVLEHTKGNQSQAAKLLGVSRNTLRKLINCYNISVC